MRETASTYAAYAEAIFAAGGNINVEEAKALRCPTFVLGGEKDAIVPAMHPRWCAASLLPPPYAAPPPPPPLSPRAWGGYARRELSCRRRDACATMIRTAHTAAWRRTDDRRWWRWCLGRGGRGGARARPHCTPIEGSPRTSRTRGSTCFRTASTTSTSSATGRRRADHAATIRNTDGAAEEETRAERNPPLGGRRAGGGGGGRAPCQCCQSCCCRASERERESESERASEKG